MNHFSNIGFKVEQREDLSKLIEALGPKSDPIKVSKGTYWKYSDPSGAALYIQTNEQNEGIGCNPHFEGTTKRAIKITQKNTGTHSPLDGTYEGWVSQELNPDYLEHPIVFESPDFLAWENNQMPFNAMVQISAFPHEIKVYESAEQAERIGEKLVLAEKSFIPSGMFTPSGEDIKPPKGEAVLSGIILKAEIKTNQYSGQQFQWMEVDTLNGPIDMVCDIGKIDAKIGHIVNGSFWLSGRIIEII